MIKKHTHTHTKRVNNYAKFDFLNWLLFGLTLIILSNVGRN